MQTVFFILKSQCPNPNEIPNPNVQSVYMRALKLGLIGMDRENFLPHHLTTKDAKSTGNRVAGAPCSSSPLPI